MQSNETYILIGVLAIVAAFFLLKDNKKPPTEVFTCARCKKQEKYSSRTIEAWRRGFKKIYCQSCHMLWLNNNPERKKKNYSSQGARGGCLGIVVLFFVIPLTIYGVVKYLS